MRYPFFIIVAAGAVLSSCDTINETMWVLQENRQAIEVSTQAIQENADAIDAANRSIEENRRQLDEINKALKKAGEG